jgi:hypothetical protein
MHGYLELPCLFDSLTRDRKDEVNLTLVKCRLSSTHYAYIGNELQLVLRLLYREIPK